MSMQFRGEYNMNNFLEIRHPSISVPVYLQLTAADGAILRHRTLVEEPLPAADDFPYPLTDEFLMYTYKVRRCTKNRSHNWTECPFAHRGEKARRRDPRKFPYSGIVCAEFRYTGECGRGFNCEFAHGVFEFWLHPSRYRTRLCESGMACPRRVCFFAHSREQLRPEGGAVQPSMFFTPEPAPPAATTSREVTAGERSHGAAEVQSGCSSCGGTTTTDDQEQEKDYYYELPGIAWIEELIQ